MRRTGIIASERKSALTRVLLLAVFLAPLTWIFGEAIFASRSFVFRDAGHYYYPLFRWTAQEWSQGRAPLWNPLENAGSPAAADPTTSVFYPGKLIFALPLEYATRFKLYVLGHLLMAGAAAWFTARRWNASEPAAAAAGVSYAFSGSIAFQYCNVVYLVGAAWLPLAMYAADGLLRHRRWTWACGLGAVLAMMVLGGDPQTAYHAGLITVLGLALRGLRGPRPRHRLMLLGGAALVAALLAAIQILPAMRWTQRSARALYSAPRTLYEVPAWSRIEAAEETSVAAALLGPPDENSHHGQLYQFSVGPWRWAEFVWPNFAGRMYPIHRRWLSGLPAEGRVWTPSLYFGLAPLAAALAAMRLRRGSFRTRWLTWTAALSIVAALGWYGAGWLSHEVRFATSGMGPDESSIGAPTGGLYWLLVQTLPGYIYFRYPAKWLTVASFALSLLAARGWDAAFTGRSRKARSCMIGVGALSVLGLAIWPAIRPLWSDWLQRVPPDEFLGPLDIDGAAADLQFALVQAAIVAGLLLIIIRSARTRWSGLAPVLAVVVTSLDLSVAQGWIAPTAPEEIWTGTPAAAAVIAADAESRGAARALRAFRASQSRWLPVRWKLSGAEDRHVEGLRWDHASLYPKHHLAPELPLVETHGALAAADYRAFLAIARRRGFVRPDGVAEPAPEALRLLGAEYLVLPRDANYTSGTVIATGLVEGDLANIAVWRDSAALPRARIVHDVTRLPPLAEHSPKALVRRTREVLLPHGRWRDFAHEAVVETDERLVAPNASDDPAPATARIVRDEPQCVEIEYQTDKPGLLVLSDLYDADWRAFAVAEKNPAGQVLPVL
ncbi:MAG: YfhO family protein [Planctomycetes bacterium]|nr:YfhO family protein [Planctomycetota bacterium]